MQDVFQSLSLSLYFSPSLSSSLCVSVCVCAALSTRFKCCSCEYRKFCVVLAKFTPLLLLLVMLAGNLFLWHFACANGSTLPHSLSLTLSNCHSLCLSLYLLPSRAWQRLAQKFMAQHIESHLLQVVLIFVALFLHLIPPPLATPPQISQSWAWKLSKWFH